MDSEITLTPATQAVADRILADGLLQDGEIQQLRRDIFQDGIVDQDEADLIFYLDANGGSGDAWRELFLVALTDFFVWKQFPPGVVSEQSAEYLIRRVTQDGRIDSATEFALLNNIMKHAKFVPDSLQVLVLQGVKATVLAGNNKLFGPDRQQAGIIEEADVDIIRNVIYGIGGDAGYTVSQAEAVLLFELNDATADKTNAPGWQDLFVKGVGNFLMFPRQAPDRPSEAEMAREQAWLAERRPKTDFFKDMASALKSGSTLKSAFGDAATMLTGGASQDELDQIARTEQQNDIAGRLSQVDAAEAQWLTQKITADGQMHENEIALLRFIKETATGVDASLANLLEKI